LALVSVLSPCYNSVSTLNRFLDQVTKALALVGVDHEVVLVDDGSFDGTWNLIKERAASDSRIKGIRLTRNFGQHPAILGSSCCARQRCGIN
jgi:glycosyltransferase involved in cell wall biosynthesis